MTRNARVVVLAVVLLVVLGVLAGTASASPGAARPKAFKRVAMSGKAVRNMSPYAIVGIGGHAI